MIHSTNLNKSNYNSITALPSQRKATTPYFNGIDNDSFNKVSTDKKSMPKSTPFFKNKILNFLAANLLVYTLITTILAVLPSPVTGGQILFTLKSKKDIKDYLLMTAILHSMLLGCAYLGNNRKKKEG